MLICKSAHQTGIQLDNLDQLIWTPIWTSWEIWTLWAVGVENFIWASWGHPGHPLRQWLLSTCMQQGWQKAKHTKTPSRLPIRGHPTNITPLLQGMHPSNSGIWKHSHVHCMSFRHKAYGGTPEHCLTLYAFPNTHVLSLCWQNLAVRH